MAAALIAAAKARPEIQRTPMLAPAQFNQRTLELVAPQEAPDPPRAGAVPVRPARRQTYSVRAMAAIRSVMAYAQVGPMGKQEFDQLVHQPRGKSLSWDERTNIERAEPETLGSRFVISPQQSTSYEAMLRAQMGI